MNIKNTGLLHVVTALIFAGAIMYSSWILGDSEHSETITLIIIALYMVPFTILSGCTGKKEKGK